MVLPLSSKCTSAYWHVICASGGYCRRPHHAKRTLRYLSDVNLLASAINSSSFIYYSLVGRLFYHKRTICNIIIIDNLSPWAHIIILQGVLFKVSETGWGVRAKSPIQIPCCIDNPSINSNRTVKYPNRAIKLKLTCYKQTACCSD